MELVDVKKKKRRRLDINNNITGVDNINDKDFNETKDGTNADFGFNNDYDNTIADLGSENNNSGSNDNVIISDIKTEPR
jgi:hypothetical protein